MTVSDSDLPSRNSCPSGLLVTSAEVRSLADFNPFSQDSLMYLLMPAGL